MGNLDSTSLDFTPEPTLRQLLRQLLALDRYLMLELLATRRDVAALMRRLDARDAPRMHK